MRYSGISENNGLAKTALDMQVDTVVATRKQGDAQWQPCVNISLVWIVDIVPWTCVEQQGVYAAPSAPAAGAR